MKEISHRKRVAVIKLYLDGCPYDEIGRRTDVSKGSVANIASELRKGLYPGFEDISDQVGLIRELAVDMKRGNISIWQARAGASLFLRLLDLGVEPEDLERWVKLCQEIATPSGSGEGLIAAALDLMSLGEETGRNYQEVLEEHQSRLRELQELGASIQESRKLRIAEKTKHIEDMDRCREDLKTLKGTIAELNRGYSRQRRMMEKEINTTIARHDLTLDKVEFVAALARQELKRSGLNKADIDSLMERIKRAGSLSALIPKLEEQCGLLEAGRAKWEKGNQDLRQSYAEHWSKVYILKADVAKMEREMSRLTLEATAAKEDLKELHQERAKLKSDIDLAMAVVGVIANPYMVTNDQFGVLLERMLIVWRLIKNIAEQRPVFVYQCPKPAEDVQRSLAELLAPLVADQFVPRWEYVRCQERLHQA